jgi:hypothetical protein
MLSAHFVIKSFTEIMFSIGCRLRGNDGVEVCGAARHPARISK